MTRAVMIDKDMLASAIEHNTSANAAEAIHIVNTVLYQQRLHGKHEDKSSADVCEGIYQDRLDDNLALCEALRAVLALAGEDAQIAKIIEDVIEERGI